MIDLVTLLAGAAAIGCGTLTYLWRSACIDRDEANTEITVERNVAEALDRRITVLRSDNITLEREVGRLKAEAVAKKPKRGPNGKFVRKAGNAVAGTKGGTLQN